MTLSGWQGNTPLEYLALFFAPFLHEDVAIVMAATFIHGLGLQPGLAFASLYAGVVVSDLLIYMLGRAAHRWLSLRRFLKEDKLQRAERRLRDNRVLAIGLCRLVPGLLFSTFFACGWFGIPFLEFAIPAVITSAVWTGVLLLLVLKFGATIAVRAGDWGWFLASGLVLVFGLGYVFSRVLRGVLDRNDADREVTSTHDTVIAGMPPVPPAARKVAESERIPPILFYIPLGLRWLWLGIRHGSITLPALADPLIEAGGLWGESKSKCLRQIAPEQARWVAPFLTCERPSNGVDADTYVESAARAMTAMGLSFPVVAKPDVGWQGFGVQRLHDLAELRHYLLAYPADTTVIVQQCVPYDAEAGILYVRVPGEETGRVTSMTLRYFPHVIGDGRTNVRELIAREPRMRLKSRFYRGTDPQHNGVVPAQMDVIPADGELVRLSFIGSIRIGGLYRDARAFITPELSARIDAIARSMPEFWFGRFDVRFKDMAQLQRGEDFAIIEVNGAGAEAIHMWDPEMPLGEAYGELLKYQTLVFKIGQLNRARGFKPMSLGELIAYTNKQNRLISTYPPSE